MRNLRSPVRRVRAWSGRPIFFEGAADGDREPASHQSGEDRVPRRERADCGHGIDDVDEDEAGRASNTHIGVIGACYRPHRLAQAETALNGRAVDKSAIQAAARAASAGVEPPEDLHASAAYRRALVGTLLERALERASR